MDQIKIGKFIAGCRKEKGLTQAVLAEKLGITDRAVSKWETGRNMPDVSLIPELCGLLDISVNELLAGEHIAMEDYREIAEQTLLEMRNKEESANRELLRAESVICALTVIATVVMIAAGMCLAPYNKVLGILLCAGASPLAVGALIYAVSLEHEAGYYECPRCGKRYVPSKRTVIWSIHAGTTRLLRCPYCRNKDFHKKVLTKEK